MTINSWPPAVFLIGAQKAGTTSLAEWLGQNPAICLSNPKEPDFFSGQWSRGWDWYRARFDAGEAHILLDASTSYSMTPIAGITDPKGYQASQIRLTPERLFQHRPDARFIYVLRDPVDRAYSGYWHARRAGDEHRRLLQAVDQQSMYVRGSLYSRQFANYHRYFAKDRFLFIDFDDLRRDPAGVVRRCCQFIGIEPHAIEEFRSHNQSYQTRRLGRAILPHLGKGVINRARDWLPAACVKAASSLLTKTIPKISPSERDHLASFFVEEYALAPELFGFALAPASSKELQRHRVDIADTQSQQTD